MEAPRLRRLVGPLVLLSIWHVISNSGLVNKVLLPTPTETLLVFTQAEKITALFAAASRTTLLSLSGFIIAATLGTILGIVVGWFSSIYDIFDLVIEFFRALPAAALLPPILLLFGIGNLAKIVLVSFACGLIVLVNTASGVRRRNPIRTMVAQIEGATKLQILFRVVLPEALPSVVIGLRISASLALILTVVAEMFISTDEGLGRRIVEAQSLFRYAEMYAAILVAGGLGFCFNKALVKVSDRFVHWAGK